MDASLAENFKTIIRHLGPLTYQGLTIIYHKTAIQNHAFVPKFWPI